LSSHVPETADKSTSQDAAQGGARTQSISCGGFNVVFSTDVQLPTEKGIFCGDQWVRDLLQSTDEPPEIVLDVGTGAGHFAIMAGLMGVPKVVATDVVDANLDAVKTNWALNGLDPDRLEVINCGDVHQLMEKLGGKVGSVVCNPPQLPTISSGTVDTSDKAVFYTGLHPNGRQLIDQIIEGTRPLLKPGGTLYTCGNTLNGWNKTQDMFAHHWGAKGEGWHVLSTLSTDLNDHTGYQQLLRTSGGVDVFEWFRSRSAQDPRIYERDGQWFADFHFIKAVRSE